MTGNGHEPALPAGAPAGRILLVAAPSPLHAAITRRLPPAALPACPDTPDRLAPAPAGSGGRLSGATVVLVTVRARYPAAAPAPGQGAVHGSRAAGHRRPRARCRPSGRLVHRLPLPQRPGAAPAARFAGPDSGGRNRPRGRRRAGGAPSHQPRRRLRRAAARLALQPPGGHHPPGSVRRPAHLAAQSGRRTPLAFHGRPWTSRAPCVRGWRGSSRPRPGPGLGHRWRAGRAAARGSSRSPGWPCASRSPGRCLVLARRPGCSSCGCRRPRTATATTGSSRPRSGSRAPRVPRPTSATAPTVAVGPPRRRRAPVPPRPRVRAGRVGAVRGRRPRRPDPRGRPPDCHAAHRERTASPSKPCHQEYGPCR
jgi:hypothetical protein